jgi:hypothetical protein
VKYQAEEEGRIFVVGIYWVSSQAHKVSVGYGVGSQAHKVSVSYAGTRIVGFDVDSSGCGFEWLGDVGLGVLGPHPKHDVLPLVCPQGSILSKEELPM